MAEEGNLRITRKSNEESKGFDAEAQFKKRYTLPGGRTTNYYGWVRFRLSDEGSKLNPVREFRERVDALCVDIHDRIEAVSAAVEAGMAAKPHPDELPENIYGTTGEWETWSSPSRDARLKASFEGLYNFVKSSIENLNTPNSEITFSGSSYKLIRKYRKIWNNKAESSECNYSYTNSLGESVPISLEDVVERIWKISFDPYHCPELRWGAEVGLGEFLSCPDGELKLSWYDSEQRLRNSIKREYDVATTLDMGPEVPVDINIMKQIDEYIASIPKPAPSSPTGASTLGRVSTFDCTVTANDPRHFGAPVYKVKVASDNHVFASAFHGDKVKVIFEDGQWYKISYNGYSGFMLKRHLGRCIR